MLKSQVPFYILSMTLIMGLPATANPGQPFSGPSTTTSKPPATRSKKVKMNLPQAGQFVHNYIRNNDNCLLIVKRRSEGPFSIIDSVLDHYGLPLELKYLAVIESDLKPSARSRVGARGPWQLMPGTAHVLGLKVNRNSDERTNFYMSTRAAALYLRDLHREFKDWLLVLAAYNGGPVPVYRAIRKAHSRDFWDLQNYLPAESRLHVKRFIATAYYFEKADSAGKQKEIASYASAKTTPATKETSETPNERFDRLMKESARSLKESNDLTKVDPN